MINIPIAPRAFAEGHQAACAGAARLAPNGTSNRAGWLQGYDAAKAEADARIDTLRAGAVQSDDAALVIACDHALGRDVVFRGPAKPHELAAVARALTMSRSQARSECARRMGEAGK